MSAAEGFSEVEHRIVTPDGELRYVHTTASVIRAEDGQPEGLLGTVQDITARKLVEIDLEQRDAILEAVAFAAQQFMRAADWGRNIQELLRSLGEKTRACWAYIYQTETSKNRAESASLRYEWARPELSFESRVAMPQVVALQVRDMERWRLAMEQGVPFSGSGSSLPEGEAEQLLIGGAKSFINVPVFVGDDWWGYIGFCDCKHERGWLAAEVDALKVAAGLIGAAVQSQRAEKARQESERLVRALGDNLPGGVIYQVVSGITADKHV